MVKKNYVIISITILFIFISFKSYAESACAKVSIEIAQELTFERTAFDAKLVLTNNLADITLGNVRVDVVIKDLNGNVKDTLFFLRKPEVTGISSLDGSGSVGPNGRVEAHWLIIPSVGAGYILENGSVKQIGVDYLIGATLTYDIQGKQEMIPINPDKITVRPMPELVLDYFMPYEVVGDNPMTPQVEAPIIYPLALRVMNDGYGPANKLRIESAQPKIVDNNQGLLIAFKLVGASVNDSAVSPSLAVDFGDLPSKKAATASWQMLSTLSGHFVNFSASFTHASELGGDLTSLLRKDIGAHYLTHMIRVNLPGRDNRLDFLADTDKDFYHLPDTIFESEIPNGGIDIAFSKSPVTVLQPSSLPQRPTLEKRDVDVTLPNTSIGWIYTKIDDPSQGLLKLEKVVRTDGVSLDPNNFWTEQGFVDEFKKKTHTLHFVDYRSDASVPGTYTLYFTQPDKDVTSPATSIIFNGPVTGDTTKFITPQTQIFFTAEDNAGGSGVEGIYKKVIGQDTGSVPAHPFTLNASADPYIIEYYSVDYADNEEMDAATGQHKTVTVKVDNTSPVISSFTATPFTFIPQAPKGVAAPRNVNFQITANDYVASLFLALDIVNSAGTVIRTLNGNMQSGTPFSINWDGKDSAGSLVATGSYTARAYVSDGLNNPADAMDHSHTATTAITIIAAEWFTGTPVDAHPAASQMYPKAAGMTVVWQDQRNGNWDIYLKDVGAVEPQLAAICTNPADQQHPAMDGSLIVWQDQRNGNWDIYGYNTTTQNEFPICTDPGDQERPVVAGDWVIWQDNRRGNWDIYGYKVSTGETVQLTTHERDQLRPAISGTTVVWEDYRHGLGEIYQYDLTSGSETRRTIDNFNQTMPAIAGTRLVWTDQRNDQKDIYTYDPMQQSLRVTYGAGDHSQAALRGNLMVYTDNEAGLTDPNLSFFDFASGAGGRLTSDPARQEEPALGTDLLFWQDNRDAGVAQIYVAPFAVQPSPIEVDIKPGFNLVAVGQWLVDTYPAGAASLLADNRIEKILGHDNLHNTYNEVSAAGGDFPLAKGMGLVVYAKSAGVFQVASSGETTSYNLLRGTNQIGLLAVPYGYSAHDLVKSVGLENIESVRHFDAVTGEWETVVVRSNQAGVEIIGVNYSIRSGDGLIITMKNRVDGWSP